jgi:hypothetical protein
MRMAREVFISGFTPILERQIELYKKDPVGYVEQLPGRMHRHFSERRPNKTISLAYVLACSLIATHRIPTAEYIFRLMSDDPAPDGHPWDANRDPDLRSYTV